MPTYAYKCLSCGHEFEVVLTLAEHEKSRPTCPTCKSERVEQLPSRFFAQTDSKT